MQHAHNTREAKAGREYSPSILAEFLHFLGEIEAIFGLWVVPLLTVITFSKGWAEAAVKRKGP